MINDVFNFLIDNRDELSLIYSNTHSFENKNIYIYETKDSIITLTMDKQKKPSRPLSIDIRRK